MPYDKGTMGVDPRVAAMLRQRQMAMGAPAGPGAIQMDPRIAEYLRRNRGAPQMAAPPPTYEEYSGPFAATDAMVAKNQQGAQDRQLEAQAKDKAKMDEYALKRQKEEDEKLKKEAGRKAAVMNMIAATAPAAGRQLGTDIYNIVKAFKGK